MLRSVVAVSVSLLWSTADCFSPIMVPPSSVPPSTFKPVELQSQSLRRRRTSTTPWPRLFAGGVPNESSSSSSSERSTKVREMASFLAMQLLEKAMQETGKEDGKSKMEMEDVQKLADTLQTLSGTKQAQDEVESTWKAAGEAVEEKKLLNVEVPETSSSMEEETLSVESSAPPASKEEELDEAVLSDTIAAESEDVASIDAEEEEEEAPLNIESIYDSSEGESSSQVADESVHEEDIEEELILDDVKPAAETSVEQEPEPVVLEKEEDAEASAEAFESLLSDPDTAATAGVMARFPDIVSKDFGRSLDVEASDIPPLRDSSKPKRKADTLETVADTAPTPETVDGSIVETALTAETTEEVEIASVEESQPETTEPEDLASSVSDASISEEEKDEDAPQAETVDSEEVDAQMQEEVEQPVVLDESDSVDMQEEVEQPVVLDESDSVDGATEAEEATLDSLATEADTQGEAEDETIVSESSGSEEDAEESPEEATTIQEDETEVPAAQEDENDGRVAAEPDSGKDVEDQDSPEDSTAQESETETPAIATLESADSSTSSTQGKFLQGIRNFFPSKREQPSLTEVHETLPNTITIPGLTSREDLIMEARKQPKSPEEEAKLAAKYGSMSIEDRAFAILTDLGMVEMSPNPDDPNYDHSQDDEYCEN
jgi:hypothetical protein